MPVCSRPPEILTTMSALYLNHFGLEKPPFQITPDTDFFFSGSHRGDVLTALIHVACHEEGIVTAVAEVGSGKTLLARLMLKRLPEHICTVYLANPCFSRDEIISAIARDLGLSGLPESIEGKLAALHEELLRRHAQGQRVVLVIDEAHTMPIESLEEVRLLSNLETSQHKLVNIMLFGQPELDELLADRRLRQVRDRVIHRFELPPLPHDEGVAYIDHRLRTAGWHGGQLISKAAVDLLLKASGGRARRINLLADKALLAAYAESKTQIDVAQVKSALRELQADPAITSRRAPPLWQQVLPLSLGLSLLMTASGLWLLKPEPVQPAAPTASTSTTNQSGSTTSLPVSPPSSPQPDPPSPPLTLPPKPAAPVSPVDAAFARTAEKMSQAKPQGHTLQIAALPGTEGIMQYMNFLERHVDSSMVFAHNRTYGRKTYTAVYLGDYSTEGEARTALNHLPKTLKANQPILRTWSGIRQETHP